MAKASVVVVVVLLAIGLAFAGVFGAFGGGTQRPVAFPSTAVFRLASNYVPPIPRTATLGVPTRSGDPGIAGWSEQSLVLSHSARHRREAD